jgi:para-aminobenzoate synthetase component 1
MTRVPFTLAQELRPAPDPAAACAALLDLPYVTWLDSGSVRGPAARYSYVMADPVKVVRHLPTDDPAADPLAIIREDLARHARPTIQGLPPFQGGYAGFIAYDFGRTLERIPRARHDDLAMPSLTLGLFDWVLAWDHHDDRCWLITTGIDAEGVVGPDHAEARGAMVLDRLAAGGRAVPGTPAHAPARAGASPPAYPVVGVEHAETIGLRSTFTHRGYLDAVARVREYIRAGDIFQANLSQRFQAPMTEAPFTLYERLRQTNPASFSAYLDYDGIQMLSASPERFLALEQRRVETRPIKGTIGRGVGPMHDLHLGRLLLESEKDRAENVMIVDLLRNDLSRVCEPGSVRVPALCELEHHPTVHHLVSTVVGTLSPDRDATDLIRASFPGGSITGAPKVRAMEIIAELEPTERGVYCGSIGWMGLDGSMDTSIVIRTFIVRDGQMYAQVGGGIVIDSDPEQEYQETLVKAKGLLRAAAGR